MSVDALITPAAVHGNYVASSQRGCHIAHYSAEWVIEASAFDAEDYGLQPGEEESVPDIVIDPETRSIRSVRHTRKIPCLVMIGAVLPRSQF